MTQTRQISAEMTSLPFVKMHGLGNDFVVLDLRASDLRVTPETARALADRRRGVGCDQVISILPSSRADAFMNIHNFDGSEVGACGNATRCVAQTLMRETGTSEVVIETIDGLLPCAQADNGLITVRFPQPRFDWQAVPLSQDMDTLHLDFSPCQGLTDPGAVNVGNPHVIFFVDNVDDIALNDVGPAIETDPLFPERVNVSIVSPRPQGGLRQRVFERGVGITQACGSGACAAMAVAHARGIVGDSCDIELDGGVLQLSIDEDGHILKTGPAATSFHGTIDPSLFETVPAIKAAQ